MFLSRVYLKHHNTYREVNQKENTILFSSTNNINRPSNSLGILLITRRYRVGKNGPLSEDTEPTAYIFILCRLR